MKVGIFYNSVTNLNRFSNKSMLMDNFAQGVRANGDTALEFRNPTLPDCDLDAGFILGYTLENNFRKKLITALEQKNVPVVYVDSNILHYARPEHEWHRYSMNSVYPNSGTYFFSDLDTTKWQNYSAWHGVEIKPWRDDGNHVLIFCQRPRGWNLRGRNQEDWLHSTVAEIQKHTKRPIMVRMHPGDGDRFQAIDRIRAYYGHGITISSHDSIRGALENCWCAVGYNSTPNVVAAIEGVPVYLEDPDCSWAKDVGFTDLSQIKNPPMPDRTEWINKIANIHWSNQEVASGKLWQAIKTYIDASR